jgi:GNAT superfamily N-acetyltransferase
MLQLIRTNSEHKDFRILVEQLDKDLTIRDGDEHTFYAQYNGIALIKHTIVAYQNDIAVGCGAIKAFDDASMEVKRMYTLPESRGSGIASSILKALETWAAELGYQTCLLETGKKQPEAIALYQKSGYEITPNYGQYAGIENSICFSKKLSIV